MNMSAINKTAFTLMWTSTAILVGRSMIKDRKVKSDEFVEVTVIPEPSDDPYAPGTEKPRSARKRVQNCEALKCGSKVQDLLCDTEYFLKDFTYDGVYQVSFLLTNICKLQVN